MKTFLFAVVFLFTGTFSFASPVCDQSSIDAAADRILADWSAARPAITSKQFGSPYNGGAYLSWSVPNSTRGDHMSIMVNAPCSNGGQFDSCRLDYVWSGTPWIEKAPSKGIPMRLRDQGYYSSTCSITATQSATEELQAGTCTCSVTTIHAGKVKGEYFPSHYLATYKAVLNENTYELRPESLSYTGGASPYMTVEAKCVGSIRSRNGEEMCGTDRLNRGLAETCDNHLDGLSRLVKEDVAKITAPVDCR